jgi:hypothetical protein
VAENLAALEAEAAIEGDALNVSGGSENKRQRRYERQPPKVISPSDPQSAWTASKWLCNCLPYGAPENHKPLRPALRRAALLRGSSRCRREGIRPRPRKLANGKVIATERFTVAPRVNVSGQAMMTGA